MFLWSALLETVQSVESVHPDRHLLYSVTYLLRSLVRRYHLMGPLQPGKTRPLDLRHSHQPRQTIRQYDHATATTILHHLFLPLHAEYFELVHG